MPQQQVSFQAIRDVVTDFLHNVQRVEFTDMQPTHLGQAFVRFRHSYDRDRLIQMGPFQFGDVSISFVEHNKGRNWRAVNFNRECWMLLLGFPPDYRENEYVVNTISSFGRVISWVDDNRHLGRLLVRARVIDLESVPQFLVITDGEGFQGDSWTVQCEILQGQLLGGLPQDEDQAPGPDDFPPAGPFDLFGFGQFGPEPFGPPNQQDDADQPENGIPGHGFVEPVEQLEQADGPLNDPQAGMEVPDLNLNVNPDALLALDLNEPADMEEMIVDPIFIGPPPPVDEEFVQVNEEEEDAQPVANENVPVILPLMQDNHEVVFPAALNPMMPMEIQEEDLMNDDEIQQQIHDDADLNNADGSYNMQVGLVLIKDTPPLKSLWFDGSWARSL
jgi:hypothetical protein